MQINKIVVTGGPCAGKTTAMSWIQNHFERMGYTVLFVPETATELISGGVAPWTCGTNLDYQKCQVRLQMVKEELFERAARTMPKDKILIVCDRGVMDNKAYMNEEEFSEVLKDVGHTLSELRDQYDAVFHLVTAAKGAEKFYTLENNAARYETVEQAREMDDRIIASWTGHPHLRVIDNSTDFDEKLKKLVNAIADLLGEEKVEMKRKFLIEFPDIRELENNPFVRKVDIIQTYLKAPEGIEHRIRQSGEHDYYTFYETIRRTVDYQKLRLERRLTEERYMEMLAQADESFAPLHKTRYYFTYDRQYLMIDIYPFTKEQAVLEAIVPSEEEDVRIPPFVKVIREVTNEPSFKGKAVTENNSF